MSEPKEEIDFFTDMEPVIQKTQALQVDDMNGESKTEFKSNFAPGNL